MRTRTRVTALAIAAALVLVVAGVLSAWLLWPAGGMERAQGGAVASVDLRPADPIATLLSTAVLPISVDEAQARNAARAPDRVALVAARPFSSGAGGPALLHLDAVECLAQAVYYEAASESEAGQRAVAQVVLNRVRHPAFPHSVCGVVYQGWERATGCQFSFTCDASLGRKPSAAGWVRARRIAGAALAGWVEPSVGLATHYHADYVVPYWAASLDKAATIGRHIFYAMRGGLGQRSMFTARYDPALEFVPLTPPTAESALVGAEGISAIDPAAAAASAVPPSRLQEDNLGKPLAADSKTQTLAKPTALTPGSGRPIEDERAGRLIGD